jgi:hypothetical protein
VFFLHRARGRIRCLGLLRRHLLQGDGGKTMTRTCLRATLRERSIGHGSRATHPWGLSTSSGAGHSKDAGGGVTASV